MNTPEIWSVLIVSLILFIISILIVRLFGAWMLRINEVIRELKEIKHLLNRRDNG